MRLVASLSLLAVLLLGFVRVRQHHNSLEKRQSFAVEFLEKLREFIRSRGQDGAAYGWLTHRAPRLQSQMGSAGIFSAFSPPFSRIIYNQYPVVLNMLPELRRWSERHSLGISTQFNEAAATLEETLIRYHGMLEDALVESDGQIWNPLIWLREGVQLLLLLPLQVIVWLGIGGGRLVATVAANFMFRLASAALAAVGFVASVITIITGAKPSLEALSKWFSQ